LRRPLIAIVDDDRSFRRATVTFVQSLDYAAVAFASAESLLESDQIDQLDCIISDVQMAKVNGIELSSHLSCRRPRLPVIFVSARPEMRMLGLSTAPNAVGFLDKPLNPDDLVSLLISALALAAPTGSR
jgi:FixJ family two-component response regulator